MIDHEESYCQIGAALIGEGGFDAAMYCLGCGYNLYGLPRNRCPECGKEFDPGDSSSFAASPRQHRETPFWGLLLVAAYPLLPLALFFGTWVAAAISLGHAPRPSADDPKSINAAVSVLYVMTVLALLGIIGWIFVAPVLFLRYVIFGRGADRGLRALLLLILSLMSLGFLWLVVAGRIGYWFLD